MWFYRIPLFSRGHVLPGVLLMTPFFVLYHSHVPLMSIVPTHWIFFQDKKTLHLLDIGREVKSAEMRWRRDMSLSLPQFLHWLEGFLWLFFISIMTTGEILKVNHGGKIQYRHSQSKSLLLRKVQQDLLLVPYYINIPASLYLFCPYSRKGFCLYQVSPCTKFYIKLSLLLAALYSQVSFISWEGL